MPDCTLEDGWYSSCIFDFRAEKQNNSLFFFTIFWGLVPGFVSWVLGFVCFIHSSLGNESTSESVDSSVGMAGLLDLLDL